MGVVMLAYHEGLGERVVLKVLRGEVARTPENLERLRREARTMARLRSEHITRVTDVGALEDGAPYLVLEYVRGVSLRGLLQERGALPEEEAVGYLLQVCEGLAQAHASGVIHRDIKPSNLMLTERPDGAPLVKILDFGIARTDAPTIHTLTESQAMLGSPLYMAPEQMRDARDVSVRSDVWALGVTLYELVTGKLPFRAYTTAAVIAAVLSEDPTPPRRHAPGLSEGLEAVLLRCLSREPDARFEDVGQLALALVPFGPSGGDQIAACARKILQRVPAPAPPEPAPFRPSEPIPLAASRTATQLGAPPHAAPSSPSRPWRWLPLALLGVLGPLLFLALRSPASPAAAPSALAAPPPAEPADRKSVV